MKKKAVVIGGGNGTAITVQALKCNLDKFDIGAIVSMSDSGGSSGRLRAEFGVLPPGDILRAILALSAHDYKILRQIFNKIRFSDTGNLNGHNLGNLFLTLTQNYGASLMDSARALEQAVEAVGRAYPASLDMTDLMAELDNGEIVKTEGAIDRPSYDRARKIVKAWLEPAAKIYPATAETIKQADYIFLGPGSLYCSVIAAILVDGAKEAIAQSQAKLIYIAGNAYEKHGETGPTVLSDFIKTLEGYLPRSLDFVIYNNAVLDEAQKKRYMEKNWGMIEYDEDNLGGYSIVAGDYEKAEGGLDKEKLGEIIRKVADI
ncbi:MAG: hypothetical protein COU31_01485 [Candidatus Magasanikbacteria bacterium CG10_big_fil_rev_8_21_14_0_10_40_10]|uniref:Gluconeogenesis factor n=1 Tax=Candidatus Magasanikbacteria bacterium CG10_big_fil_rev_8_21_14_0_10_40_10 TaxID=1974648 RepID=A0A2M6W4J5_9BACT|nr:MAG: hypothetical protein COU31_01485 [Candidatus Magasanikbacteria bacterium CG10_big_fil_rev_8_21_14_0_10_40_10]